MTVGDALRLRQKYLAIVLFGYSPSAEATNRFMDIRDEVRRALSDSDCVLEDVPPDTQLPLAAREAFLHLQNEIIPAEAAFYAGKRRKS